MKHIFNCYKTSFCCKKSQTLIQISLSEIKIFIVYTRTHRFLIVTLKFSYIYTYIYISIHSIFTKSKSLTKTITNTKNSLSPKQLTFPFQYTFSLYTSIHIHSFIFFHKNLTHIIQHHIYKSYKNTQKFTRPIPKSPTQTNQSNWNQFKFKFKSILIYSHLFSSHRIFNIFIKYNNTPSYNHQQ